MRRGLALERGERFQRGRREFGATDQEIGEIDVFLVVEQFAAIDSAHMAASGSSNGDRGARIPFVLTAAVGVDLTLAADNGHGLRSCGSHLDQVGAHGFGHMYGRGGRATAGNDHARRGSRVWVKRVSRCRREDHFESRKRHCASDGPVVLDQSDMHSPVGAWHFGELAGAIEGVDDPGAFGAKADEIVLAFFGENCVTGASGEQTFHQQLMSLTVALGLQHCGRCVFRGQSISKFDQEMASFLGEVGRELMVILGSRHRNKFLALWAPGH